MMDSLSRYRERKGPKVIVVMARWIGLSTITDSSRVRFLGTRESSFL